MTSNISLHHLISSTTLLLSNIATSDALTLHNFHQELSVYILNQEPDHLTELMKSVQDAVKVELSTRKP
jgi:DNA-binding FadR family transcriptional regulator